MNIQKFRKALILVSALLFPITIYYYSPYILIRGAMESVICGSFIVFGGMLLTSIFFGRFFCGYFCAGAGLGEMAGAVNDKPSKLGKGCYLKYGIWVTWLALVVWLFIRSGGIKAIDLLYGTTSGVSITSIPEYGVYYLIVLLLFGLPLVFGKRAFCHYLCWMAPFMNVGMKIGDVLHLPRLRLVIDKTNCNSCKRCTTQCPMGLDVQKQIQQGEIWEAECSLCGACIAACPKQVIAYGFGKKSTCIAKKSDKALEAHTAER